ncbi:MAG: aldolase/citrate lyase family protein [Planctomycetaceae bacterium]
MNGIDLGKALRGGVRVYGTCVISPAPQWPRMIAKTGLDFVFIDTEHIVLDRAQLSWMCQTYAGLGMAPIVRRPAPDPYLATQMVDAGAVGVIVPYVESVSQVHDLRGAVKLRPLKGNRLSRVLSGEEQLSQEERQYLTDYNQGNLCIVNIESIPALNALDDILAMPDIDALLIGPHDLSINLGIAERYDHARFEEAVRTVFQKGRNAGVGVGMHYSGSDGKQKLSKWADWGMNLVIHSSDLCIVGNTLKQDIDVFRAQLGDAGKLSTNVSVADLHV